MKKKLAREFVRVIVERHYPYEHPPEEDYPISYNELIIHAPFIDDVEDEKLFSALTRQKIQEAREKNKKRGVERFGY